MAIAICGIICLLSCKNKLAEEKELISQYRSSIASKEKSVAIGEQDSVLIDSALSNLIAKGSADPDSAAWRRNPFQEPQQSVSLKIENKNLQEKIPDLILTGIIQRGDKKKALINGMLYEMGAEIGDCHITEIGDKFVILRDARQKVYKLQLTE